MGTKVVILKVTLVAGDKKILIFADIGSIYNSVACLKSLLLTIKLQIKIS